MTPDHTVHTTQHTERSGVVENALKAQALPDRPNHSPKYPDGFLRGVETRANRSCEQVCSSPNKQGPGSGRIKGHRVDLKDGLRYPCSQGQFSGFPRLVACDPSPGTLHASVPYGAPWLVAVGVGPTPPGLGAGQIHPSPSLAPCCLSRHEQPRPCRKLVVVDSVVNAIVVAAPILLMYLSHFFSCC